MKNLILLLLVSTFLISCQMKTENVEITQYELPKNQSEISTVPTPEPKQENINSKIELVVNNGKKLIVCLRIDNADLAKKTPIEIVDPFGQPQRAISAEVRKKLEQNCTTTNSNIGVENPENIYYYSLDLLEKDEQSSVGIGIGVVNPSKPATIDKGLVSIDINDDGKAEYFRHCAGIDGTLLTTWTGKPLKGKRIWHDFYYLDYDVETDCTEKESENSDN